MLRLLTAAYSPFRHSPVNGQLDLKQEGTTLRVRPQAKGKIITTGAMATRSESGPLAAHIFGIAP